MNRIAVLGSNGQLGKTIKWITRNADDSFIFLSKQEVDITDKNSLILAFNQLNLDYCINCAAYTNVEIAEKDAETAFLINAKGAKNIAEVCRSYNVRLIHVSTDYVFDGTKDTPYTTLDITNPINQYGKSKLQGELYVKETLIEHFIIRTSWLYSIFGKNFLKTIISKIENDESLNITVEEQGTPTSCFDLAEFILYVIKSTEVPFGIYNFSANGSTTWYGFAQEISKHFEASYSPEKLKPVEKFKTFAKRPIYSVLDLKKTETVYKDLNNWKTSTAKVIELYLNEHSERYNTKL